MNQPNVPDAVQLRQTASHRTALQIRDGKVIGIYESPTVSETKLAVLGAPSVSAWHFNSVPKTHPVSSGDLTDPESWGKHITLPAIINEATAGLPADSVTPEQMRQSQVKLNELLTQYGMEEMRVAADFYTNPATGKTEYNVKIPDSVVAGVMLRNGEEVCQPAPPPSLLPRCNLKLIDAIQIVANEVADQLGRPLASLAGRGLLLVSVAIEHVLRRYRPEMDPFVEAQIVAGEFMFAVRQQVRDDFDKPLLREAPPAPDTESPPATTATDTEPKLSFRTVRYLNRCAFLSALAARDLHNDAAYDRLADLADPHFNAMTPQEVEAVRAFRTYDSDDSRRERDEAVSLAKPAAGPEVVAEAVDDKSGIVHRDDGGLMALDGDDTITHYDERDKICRVYYPHEDDYAEVQAEYFPDHVIKRKPYDPDLRDYTDYAEAQQDNKEEEHDDADDV